MRPLVTRRQLLAGSAAALVARPWLGRAVADAAGPTHLIVVTALGGWDVSFALDPKPGSRRVHGPELDEDRSNADDREEVQTFSGIPVMTNPHKRPAQARFFERWASRTLVINGVHTGTIAHEECRVRMLTGALTADHADLAAITGATLGAALPVPYMDVGGSGYTGPLAALSGRAGLNGQLAQLLERGRQLKGPRGLDYPQYAPRGADEDAIEAWLASADARFAAEMSGWGTGAARVDDLLEARQRAQALLAGGSRLANGLDRARGLFETNRLTAGADIALELLTSGVAHTVNLDTGSGWDTHTDNTDQHGFWQKLFDGLDHLLTSLQDASLLDRTAVLVLSEMGRTPLQNGNGGKDHWPVTSAMLLGGPVAGGRVIGATDDGMEALPVDLATGEPDPAGLIPRYDHLAAGVLSLLDVDPAPWLGAVPALGGLR